ncbi:MAG: NUDIX domain-containing protein [Acutalibacteraceae bacterium]|nr:NUDIX domain-containing protein [Acutalibacteraceae bacterium]
MLGAFIDVSILGKISPKGVYTGYICKCGEKRYKRASIVVFSRTELPDMVHCTVIATTQLNSNIKFIAAPSGQIFYEPEIKELLKEVRNVRYHKLTCLYEKSCGAIVFHRFRDGIKVLLVKNHNGKYWSFPKGHMEKGENEHQTAAREIKEETGLSVYFYDNYRQISDYVPFGKIKKRVVFFLAEAKYANVHIQKSEIDLYTWVTFDEAQKMCKYENDLRVLKKAENTIILHDKRSMRYNLHQTEII